MSSLVNQLLLQNEDLWVNLGRIAESMTENEKAIYCYEQALKHNYGSHEALSKLGSLFLQLEHYSKAIEYLGRALEIVKTGELFRDIGICYMMMNDLQRAFSFYQNALFQLPQDYVLWYNIAILYERYNSLENAEEAFQNALRSNPRSEKTNEIIFRLAIIYKQQMKYEKSLEHLQIILSKPPNPLSRADLYFQLGHIYELQKDFNNAKENYETVLTLNPKPEILTKSLQQLGWLYHNNSQWGNQDTAISYLMRSLETEKSDGQTWYLLGRCYMAQQKYRKAYDAYQQAVYRDPRNPTFWCSIGVLYYQINQYRDALDAYSRAIRLNPHLSEVWYDLGTLYESCSQLYDSVDAFQKAAELDPSSKHIHDRLQSLRAQLSNNNNNKPNPAQPLPPSQPLSSVKPGAPLSMINNQLPPSGGPHMQLIPEIRGPLKKSSDSSKSEVPSMNDLVNSADNHSPPEQRRSHLSSSSSFNSSSSILHHSSNFELTNDFKPVQHNSSNDTKGPSSSFIEPSNSILRNFATAILSSPDQDKSLRGDDHHHHHHHHHPVLSFPSANSKEDFPSMRNHSVDDNTFPSSVSNFSTASSAASLQDGTTIGASLPSLTNNTINWRSHDPEKEPSSTSSPGSSSTNPSSSSLNDLASVSAVASSLSVSLDAHAPSSPESGSENADNGLVISTGEKSSPSSPAPPDSADNSQTGTIPNTSIASIISTESSQMESDNSPKDSDNKKSNAEESSPASSPSSPKNGAAISNSPESPEGNREESATGKRFPSFKLDTNPSPAEKKPKLS